jgi:hypothetical protein
MPPEDMIHGDMMPVHVWIQFVLQTGALGLLGLIVWLVPKVLRDTLRELNEHHDKQMGVITENMRGERQGFLERTQLLVNELSDVRKAFPQLGLKIDVLIEELHQQTEILRNWPSDPAKWCLAGKRFDDLEKVVHNLTRIVTAGRRRKKE